MKLHIHTLDGDVITVKDVDQDEADTIVAALPQPANVLNLDLGPDKGMTYIRVGAIARVDLD